MSKELKPNTIELPDGRVFPIYQGEILSWPIGSTFTLRDELDGYPRTRLVLSLTSDAQLEKARYEELKASFNSMFGHVAKKLLTLIEGEIEARTNQYQSSTNAVSSGMEK